MSNLRGPTGGVIFRFFVFPLSNFIEDPATPLIFPLALSRQTYDAVISDVLNFYFLHHQSTAVVAPMQMQNELQLNQDEAMRSQGCELINCGVQCWNRA